MPPSPCAPLTSASLAIAAFALAVPGTALAETAACPPAPDRTPVGLPATVVVATTQRPPCAVRVGPDGRVEPTRWRPLHWQPPRSIVFPLTAPGFAVATRRERLVVVARSSRRVLWRSRNRYPHRGVAVIVTGLAVGAGRVAFSVSDRAGAEDRARLYVARLGEEEREIAGLAGEHPVGWTAAGDLVTRSSPATLRLRAPDGRLRRVLARGVRAFDWDPASRAVVVVERGALRRLNSSQDAVLIHVRALRMREAWLWVQALERGLIALVGRRAIAVVRADGRLWGRSEFPRGGEIAGHGSLTTSPDGGAIAFVNLHHRAGIATVQLLREGGRRADRLLMRRFVPLANPVFSAGLAWRGDWLLAWTTHGSVVAVHPRSGRRVVLDGVVRRLAGGPGPPRTGIQAAWAGR